MSNQGFISLYVFKKLQKGFSLLDVNPLQELGVHPKTVLKVVVNSYEER